MIFLCFIFFFVFSSLLLSSLFSLLFSLSVFFLCLLCLLPLSLSPCVGGVCVVVCVCVVLYMLVSMWAWCRCTRGRFESTHRKRSESTHGGHRQFCKPRKAHVGLSLGPKGSPKVTTGCCPRSSLRKDREQHVPDSSKHSLYLIKLLSSSYPEGNFGGNQP